LSLKQFGNEYLSIAELWEKIAEKMMDIYEIGNKNIIDKMSKEIFEIAEKEEKVMEKILLELK
jgi:hypothetical protein